MQSDTPHILIIDDDIGMLRGLPEMLQHYINPLAINTCSSPQQALNLIENEDFDAIISDIKMPGMDGLTLLAEIRRMSPDTPVLMITSHDDREIVLRALRGGAYDFILKPIVDVAYVAASLQRAIQNRQLSRQVATQKEALERHAEELEQAVSEAVAEAQAAQRRLTFLAEASNLLSLSLDYEENLSRLARLAVLYLADYCVIDIMGEDGQLRTVALAHRDPSQETLVRQLRERYQDRAMREFAMLPAALAERGRGLLQPYITDEMLAASATDADELTLLRKLRLQSSMLVPLVAQGRILGALLFVSNRPGRHYNQEDLALAEDLTRRAALSVNNSRLYNEAQQALHVRDQFLSIAAHELKTPITSIMGTAQLLLRSAERTGEANPRDVRRLQLLNDQTRRLNRLLDSLLNLSRLEAGQLTIEQTEVDITKLVQRVNEEVMVGQENHRLEYSSEEEPLLVCGDELRLEQVFQNLLQNAIKYSPDGGVVRTQLRRTEEQIEISVSDEGIGIPPDALPMLFSRFYRADHRNARQISGIGLGLYVVKEIINLHGGSISVTSAEGQGSTFTIRLPVYQPANVVTTPDTAHASSAP